MAKNTASRNPATALGLLAPASKSKKTTPAKDTSRDKGYASDSPVSAATEAASSLEEGSEGQGGPTTHDPAHPEKLAQDQVRTEHATQARQQRGKSRRDPGSKPERKEADSRRAEPSMLYQMLVQHREETQGERASSEASGLGEPRETARGEAAMLPERLSENRHGVVEPTQVSMAGGPSGNGDADDPRGEFDRNASRESAAAAQASLAIAEAGQALPGEPDRAGAQEARTDHVAESAPASGFESRAESGPDVPGGGDAGPANGPAALETSTAAARLDAESVERSHVSGVPEAATDGPAHDAQPSLERGTSDDRAAGHPSTGAAAERSVSEEPVPPAGPPLSPNELDTEGAPQRLEASGVEALAATRTRHDHPVTPPDPVLAHAEAYASPLYGSESSVGEGRPLPPLTEQEHRQAESDLASTPASDPSASQGKDGQKALPGWSHPEVHLEAPHYPGYGFRPDSPVPGALLEHLVHHGVARADAQVAVDSISSGLHHALDNPAHGKGAQLAIRPQEEVAVSIEPPPAGVPKDMAIRVDLQTLRDVHRDGLPQAGVEAIRQHLGEETRGLSQLEVVQTFGHDVVQAVAREGFPSESMADMKGALQQHAQRNGLAPESVSDGQALQALGHAARDDDEGKIVLRDKDRPEKSVTVSATTLRQDLGWGGGPAPAPAERQQERQRN